MGAPVRPSQEGSPEASTTPDAMGLRGTVLHYFVFVAFGFSGAAALIYEVVWTRKLAIIMGSSTYALSTILAAFMMGLSLGGLLGGLWVPRLRRHLRAFAICEIAIGLSALATIPLITAASPLFIRIYFLFGSSFSVFTAAQFGIVFLIVLVPTTLMGITFPLVIRHFAEGRNETARRAGFLYAFNTFGAVIGSTAAGFFLIPRLGASDATLMAALLNIVGALAILALLETGSRRFAFAPILLVAAAALRLADTSYVPFVSAYSAHRFESYEVVAAIRNSIESVGADNIIVFRHEGVESDVHLMREAPAEDLILSNNGKLEGGEDLIGFALLAELPYFSREEPGSAPTALNIGLGSGATLSRLAGLPLARIESVEISEGILEANRLFLRPALFSDPRIKHVVADGRRWLLVNEAKRYEVIVVSPSWAVELASAGLLSDEFFALAATRLAPDGVIAIWLDRFYGTSDDLDVVLRTFRRSFRHATAWATETDEMLLIGSLRPFPFTNRQIADRVAAHAPETAGRFWVARSDEDFERLPAGPIHTDDRPILEFRNARSLVTHRPPSG